MSSYQHVEVVMAAHTVWEWSSEWRTTWCIPCGSAERRAQMAASSWTASRQLKDKRNPSAWVRKDSEPTEEEYGPRQQPCTTL